MTDKIIPMTTIPDPNKPLSRIMESAHQHDRIGGMYDKDKNFYESAMRVVSEVSAAAREYHVGNLNTYWEFPQSLVDEIGIDEAAAKYPELGVPCGVPAELADALIGLLDIFKRWSIDPDVAVAQKMAHRANRAKRLGYAD